MQMLLKFILKGPTENDLAVIQYHNGPCLAPCVAKIITML